MAPKKKESKPTQYKLECIECNSSYTIKYQGKESVSYCPICGEDLVVEPDDVDIFEDEDDTYEEDYIEEE